MLRTRVRLGFGASLVLSLVFSTVFTFVATLEVFFPSLAPQLGAPAPMTLRVPYGPHVVDAPATGDHTSLQYARIRVPRGTMLDEEVPAHRAAFAYESIRRPASAARVLGLWGIVFMLSWLVTAYMRRFGQNRIRLLRTQLGIFGLITLALAVSKAMLLFTALPEFWIPLTALSLWIALAFDRRTSFLVDVGVSFVAASMLRFDPVFLAVILVRGVAASLLFFNRKHPRQMIVAGTLSGLAAGLAYAALTSVFEGTAGLGPDLASGLESNLLGCVGGGILSGFVASLLHEGAQSVMGHVSRAKLLDLTDLEQPLLRKMAREAPGSWEHARAMANLAEAAASSIGADALLTRVGAYYHDLGKTVQPKYFVENLLHGERSPHDDLDPDVSADAIMAHVVLGTKILRDGGIPEPVAEFAYTHHGTQVVEFFWHKCREQGNPKRLSIDYFRYPGMKPQTKETAILMLVDSIEAASRTVWPPEHDKFEEMIRRIVFTKLGSGQLDESGLTIEDLRVVSSRMAQTLVNMYHGRIKYPWQREQKEPETNRAQPGADAGKSGNQDAGKDENARDRAETAKPDETKADETKADETKEETAPKGDENGVRRGEDAEKDSGQDAPASEPPDEPKKEEQ